MKEFETSVREAQKEDPEEPIEFRLPPTTDREGKQWPGEVLKCFRPTDGQTAVLMASIGRGSSETDTIAGIINFFDSLLDEHGSSVIAQRLLNRDDYFGPEEINEIMVWMVEEWSGRPIQPPSGSAPSQPNGGPNSTPPTQPSTSSPSLLTGS